MSNADIKRVMARREALRKEIAKIDDFLELYREIVGTPLENVEVNVARKAVENGPRRLRRRVGKPGAVSSHDLGPQLRAIMEEHGAPMKRGHILEALEARGITLAGVNPGKYLGTILWRMREAFINIEGYGYWPRDLPNRIAHYRPDTEILQLQALPGPEIN
jgi:hypothetical protein